MAVERAVVDALGLEEDHRIIVLDRRDQQALGVIGRRRDHRLQPATWVKMPSGLWLCVWPPKMPPPKGERTVIGAVNSPAER